MSTNITRNSTYIDGHEISFLEQGSGSPVNLLHGIPTNSLMWRNIIPQLACQVGLFQYGWMFGRYLDVQYGSYSRSSYKLIK